MINNIHSIDKNKDEFVITMDEVSSIAQESAASTEEQSASITQVTDSAIGLNDIAESLKNLVNKFII